VLNYFRLLALVGTAIARNALIAKAKELVKLARHQGYRHDELMAIMETLR
jgi:hypothetical protein